MVAEQQKIKEEPANSEGIVFDTMKVMEIIPHRPPFLLVDKIVEFEENKRIVGIKNATINEDFFSGHFPGRPVMPGVLILESMAQVGAILAKKSAKGIGPEKNLYLVGANNVKWKKMVLPGDTLRIEMTFDKRRGPLWMMDAEVTIDGKLIASASIQAMEA